MQTPHKGETVYVDGGEYHGCKVEVLSHSPKRATARLKVVTPKANRGTTLTRSVRGLRRTRPY